MNKHIDQLIQYPPHILQSRVESLMAELDRKRESLPIKVLAFVAAFLSLISIGTSTGFNSLLFLLPALIVAIYAGVVAIGAWGLRANLRVSIAALIHISS